ncbi:hypothetical protein Angca_004609, partial [Angiostrongylus cantonensis]
IDSIDVRYELLIQHHVSAMKADSSKVIKRRLSVETLKSMHQHFNAKIGPRRSSEERQIGTQGLEWNEQGERLTEFIMATKTIHGNSQFHKPHRQRWTWESLNGEYHNEIDHIIVNRKFCLTDVAVVPNFYTGSDHRLLRARFYFSRKGEKAAK